MRGHSPPPQNCEPPLESPFPIGAEHVGLVSRLCLHVRGFAPRVSEPLLSCLHRRDAAGGRWPAGAGGGGAEPHAAPGGGGTGHRQRVAGAGQRVLTRDPRVSLKLTVTRDKALGTPAFKFQALKCYHSSS